MSASSFWGRLRTAAVGKPRDLSDRSLFHKLSLVAVLAWVGLGADGLSSSCYGPEETYKALGEHPSLAVFIAFMCVGTITVLCVSYRQIIELFPTGGGGYLVASKLLGKGAGVVSGSALLVDYVLTIAISIASGADALFSLLPLEYQTWKLPFAIVGVAGMTLLNLRGVRESVIVQTPVFFLFILTHAAAILIAVGMNLGQLPDVATRTTTGIQTAHTELGLIGIALLVLRAFSVGAGTYTGIEAVSNGLPVLRAPQAETGKRTMIYMGVSLAITVFGLLLAYLLVDVKPVEGKTYNAVLFETITQGWPSWLGNGFVFISLASATALLFIAAQAGFVDGPRVLANMALDRWFPARFALLSDRFVAQNGLLLMGVAAILTLLATGGSVGLLVVLYSLNVFLTFTLSQLGMCVHWIKQRSEHASWLRGFLVNGVGLLVSAGILMSLCAIKFLEGGWVTLAVTSCVVLVACLVKQHYAKSAKQLQELNAAIPELEKDSSTRPISLPVSGSGRTAIMLCNGYNGLGVHSFFRLFRMFPNTFDHIHFVMVGSVDAGTFKSDEEIEQLNTNTRLEAEKYVLLAQKRGLQADSATELSIDTLDTIRKLTDSALEKHPNAIVFAGQLAFQQETQWTRILHNFVAFTLQRDYCRRGIPFVIVPVRVG